jgi:hypothetical protein
MPEEPVAVIVARIEERLKAFDARFAEFCIHQCAKDTRQDTLLEKHQEEIEKHHDWINSANVARATMTTMGGLVGGLAAIGIPAILKALHII